MESQKAAQFEKGRSGNPTGKASEQANLISESPGTGRADMRPSIAGEMWGTAWDVDPRRNLANGEAETGAAAPA